jgi:hypothetical protein
MVIARKYVWPIVLGFVGMFACHLGLFLCSLAGITFMAYLIVYPIVYPVLTVVLTIVEPRLWLTNALFLCIVPFLYWYTVLWTDGRLNLHDLSLFESSGMSVIILLALGLSIVVGFVVSKLRRSKQAVA